MPTVINVRLTTPETNEHSVNARVHQMEELWKKFHVDNIFIADIQWQQEAEKPKESSPQEIDEVPESTAMDVGSQE